MISHMFFMEEHFSGGKITFRKLVRVDFVTPNFPIIIEYIYLSNILLLYDWRSSHYVYVCPWTHGRLVLFMTHINICCWLPYSTEVIYCSSCTYSSFFPTSTIFLLKTLYLDAAVWGVYDPWTKYIIDLIISSWIVVTRRRNWNWGFFARLLLGGLLWW